MGVSEAAVEAAAKHLFYQPDAEELGWVRAALEAAYPAIRADIAAEVLAPIEALRDSYATHKGTTFAGSSIAVELSILLGTRTGPLPLVLEKPYLQGDEPPGGFA